MTAGNGLIAGAVGGGDASITNDGTINAAAGIGLVANATAGGNGNGTATIVNHGSVFGGQGTELAVVNLQTDSGAASLTNTGTIAAASASDFAIFEAGGDLTVYNYGTIIGFIAAQGNNTVFNNESSGVWDIGGYNSFGLGTNVINNDGSITGFGNLGDGDNTVTLNNNADGTVDANVAGFTLTLSTGSNAINNDNILEATAGGILNIQSDVINASSNATIDAHGGLVAISSPDGDTLISGSGLNGLISDGGTLFFDNLSGAAANVDIKNGGIVDFQGANSAGATIVFQGAGTLVLGDPQDFGSNPNSITGISNSDFLDLAGFVADSTTVTAGAFNSGNGTTLLTVSDPTDGLTTVLTLNGDYAGTSWAIISDNNGGAYVYELTGTLVTTIGIGDTLDVSVPFSETVNFAGAGTLILGLPALSGQPGTFQGEITNFGPGDILDLTDLANNPGRMSVSWSQGNDSGTLTISNGTQQETINLAGTYTQGEFCLASDSGTGTEVVFNLVSNASFQTGDFTGWNEGKPRIYGSPIRGLGPIGSYAAFIGPLGLTSILSRLSKQSQGTTIRLVLS